MPFTPNGLPYPSPNDAPDGAAQIKALAETLDKRVADGTAVTYTPTHNMGAAIASVSGVYLRIGQAVIVAVRAVLAGPLTVAVSPSFSLPVAALAGTAMHGATRFVRTGTNDYHGGASANGANLNLAMVSPTDGQSQQIGPSVPFTWKAGDVIEANATYLTAPR